MEDRMLKDSFIERLNNNQGIISKICNIYCFNEEDRKDLYQEITLQLWRSYPGFKQLSAFSTWMYRVSLNTALYYKRKENKHQNNYTINENITASIEDDDYKSDLEEELKYLFIAITELKKIDRAIIMLYLDKRSYQEISDITGLSRSNVSVKLVRIKLQLEKKLRKTFN